MGLFDTIKDPAGEIADEIADGTEVVIGNIGKIGVAAVGGGATALKDAFRKHGAEIAAGITIFVICVAGWHALKIVYPPTGMNARDFYR